MTSVTFIVLLTFIAYSNACPPWTIYNNTASHCVCGSDLEGLVHCNSETYQVSVQYCYCMTYNEKNNMTLLGHCTAMCIMNDTLSCKSHNTLPTNNTKKINSVICGKLNRKGQLCGDCIKDHAPPVYSYSSECVKCDGHDFKYNLLKYITVAFLPLTVFYLIVITFKIRVTSGFIVAYILISQLLAVPTMLRFMLMPQARPSLSVKLLIAMYAIWNLDVFRSVYTPFCIHPNMTTLQVLALDYAVGVYPLILITLTYIAVTLHDRYPLIIRIWRPVNRLLMCIRREWDIRGSLIQAFATFLILSYVKILNASFDLLVPVSLMQIDGEAFNQTYLYNAGEIPYFGKEHLPYGTLAITMVVVFNLLPMIFLFLYPCACCRKCLNFCRLNNPSLQIFMDAFQGCYRRNHRCFAALYLFLRILQHLTLAAFKNTLFVPITVLYYIIVALAIIIFKPYRDHIQNIVDAGFLLLFALGHVMYIAYFYAFVTEPELSATRPFNDIMTLIALFFLFYGFIIIVRVFIPKQILVKFKNCTSFIIKKLSTNNVQQEEFLPECPCHRIN